MDKKTDNTLTLLLLAYLFYKVVVADAAVAALPPGQGPVLPTNIPN